MGQFTSSHSKKETKATGPVASVESEYAPPARPRHDLFLAKYAEIMREKGYLPEIFLVHETSSSQFVDEDGDEAHEFYTEQKSGDGHPRRLHRVLNNLRPKGKERYAIPRIRLDAPIVMWEVERRI